MSKFNKTTKKTTVTKNHEGGKAYTLSPELELYSTVVTSMLSDKFYEGSNDNLTRIKALITKVKPEFVAKLAVYAREKMYLRTIPLVLTVELAKIHSGDNLIGRMAARVIQRADEITELLGYYALANARGATKKLGKLSKQLQRGLSVAFNKFNEYQFAKYNRDGAVKLKDALFITHPKAKDGAQQAIFDKIVADKLETPDTWEVELSKGGDKKESWERLIREGSLGYMALLRNLRNIIEAGVRKDILVKVCERLSDHEEVAKSKQFPFRFLSAYKEIESLASGKASIVLDALEEAMMASAKNIKGFDWGTAVTIACDTSGSMSTTLSDKSKVRMQDVGLILGCLLQHKCKDVESGIFGDSYKIVNLPKTGILGNARKLDAMSGAVGHSTNGYLVIQDLIKRKEVKDKVMIFSDLQLYDSRYSWGSSMNICDLWKTYKQDVAPNAKLYMFDLAGYGNSPVSTTADGVYLIAGWSDKVFDMLDAYEQGGSAIEEIENIVL